MKVWAYTIVRNEAQMLPWWLRHYGSFCDRMIVYDDKSDDGTPDIALKAGADVRPLPYTGLDDGMQAQFSSTMYKEARCLADYVIVVDADELLVGPIKPGMILPKVQGYQMFAETMPTGDGQLYEYVTKGWPYIFECKPCIFNPDLNLMFAPGRHRCNQPYTSIETGLSLRHYRWFGRQYFLDRSERNNKRQPVSAQTEGWGWDTAPDHREFAADVMERMIRKSERRDRMPRIWTGNRRDQALSDCVNA